VKLFNFRGGVHPQTNKHWTAERPIQRLPLPKRLYVPLQQHIGLPAEALVTVNEHVLKGQLLGYSQGPISAPVHAPSSGTVIAIGDVPAPHVSGLPVRTITLETDGEDRWLDPIIPTVDPLALAPEAVAEQVGNAGIVGMGGAVFPAAVKLSAGRKTAVHTLLLNGAECEPYLTCDDRVMREMPEQIVDGAQLMLHALQAQRAIIVVEANKPAAIAALTQALLGFHQIELVTVPTRYPMGSEKQMIRTVTGREVPASGLGTDVGVLVHNVATAQAVHRALRYGYPLVSRVVTVTGSAIANPQNLEVPIGTPIAELLDFCGGLTQPTARLLMGGPMMGQSLPSPAVPVVKGLNGIVALTASEAQTVPPTPCIRCGRCVASCPMGLMPVELTRRIHHEDYQSALDFGLIDCIACGSCAYACPSHIPIVQYLNFAKGELADRQRAEQKTKEIRRLTEQRQERLAREAWLKAEAAARRKAERLAQKAQKRSRVAETET
jgi:electron transport complex protein RnfC